MGFGAEMKDFVSSFKAGADIIGGIKGRQERAADRASRDADRDEDRALREQDREERRARGEGYGSVEEKEGADRIRSSNDMPAGGVKSDPRVAQAIVDTANELGVDPVDYATTISYETGGTFDPWKKGPRTQHGQHRGFIQWGETQAKDYGVTPDMDPVDQIKASGQYLRDRGVKPGAKLVEIYSAINAGNADKKYWGKSDAKNGGAPGSVWDKVQGMGDHRQKAMAYLGSALSPQPARGSVQTADLPALGASVAGGVLPEPEEDEDEYGFAEGGAVPGVVTKDEVAKNLYPTRAYTQDVGGPVAGGFVPRRVGSPSPTRAAAPAGAAPAGTGYGVGQVTPRQAALRAKNAPKPKVAAAVVKPAAAAAVPAGSMAGFKPRSGPAPVIKGFNAKQYDDHFTDENIYGNVAYGNKNPGFDEYARWRLGETEYNRAINARGYANPQGGNNEGVNYYANQPSYNLSMGYAEGGVVDRYMPEEDDDVPEAIPMPEKPMAEDGGGVTDRYMPPEGAPIPEPMDHPDRELASGGDKSLGYNTEEDKKDGDPDAAADRLLDRNDAYKLIEKALAPVLAQSQERSQQGIIPEPVREGAEAAGRVAGAAANRAGEVIVDKVNEGVGAARRAGDAIGETVKGVIPDRVFPEGSAGEQMVKDVGGAYDKWAGAVEKNVTVGPAPGESLPEKWAAKVRENVTPGVVPEENVAAGTDPMTADAMPPQPPRRPGEPAPAPDGGRTTAEGGAQPPVDPNAPGPGASTAKQAVSSPQEHPAPRRVAKTLSRKLQETGAIPDPAARQSAMNRFLKASDALTPQEYREVSQAVDPEGKLSEADRHIKVQQDLYDYYVAHGNQKKADQAAESVAMYGKKKSQVAGGMAMAALENGDLKNGVQWLTYGYGYYSSGAVIEIDPKQPDATENGEAAVRFRMKDRKTGKPMGDWDTATKGELQQLAGGMATGTTWVNDLLRTAQGKGVATRGPTAGQERQAQRSQEEDLNQNLQTAGKALQEAQKSGDSAKVAQAEQDFTKAEEAYARVGGRNSNTQRQIDNARGIAAPGARDTATGRGQKEEAAWYADNEKKIEAAPDRQTAKTLFDAGMTRLWNKDKPVPPPATKVENAVANLPPADQETYSPLMEEIMGRNVIPAQRAIAAIDAIRARPKGLKLVGGRVVVPGFGQPLILNPDLMDRIAKLGPKAAGT